MRRSLGYLFRSALTIALLGATSWTYAAEPQVQVSKAQERSLGVRVAHPVSARTDQTLAMPAQIVIPTTQLWVVSAPVAGMVASVAVARGERVMRGQALLTLESPAFVSLQRDYLHALSQEALLATRLQRNTELYKDRALALQALQASQTEARQASIAVAERHQMLRLSGLSDTAIAQLKKDAAISSVLTVAAPEDATVVDIAISPGLRLDQSAPLLKLARLSPVWAEIAVPAIEVRAIKPGARVDVDGYDRPGKVLLVSETIDAATQTVLVRAEVPNDGGLRPGQSAAVRIGFTSPGESAWEVPSSALVRRGESAAVFVAIGGGYRLQPVQVVAEDQDHVVVSGAITDKDSVAVSGVSGLRGILLGLGAGE